LQRVCAGVFERLGHVRAETGDGFKRPIEHRAQDSLQAPVRGWQGESPAD
jgi:hypothetical protein